MKKQLQSKNVLVDLHVNIAEGDAERLKQSTEIETSRFILNYDNPHHMNIGVFHKLY